MNTADLRSGSDHRPEHQSLLAVTVFDKLAGFRGLKCGRGASDDEISAAESKLGLQFPAALGDFLRRFGWCRVGHLEFYGLGRDAPDCLHMTTVTLDERQQMEPPLALYLLPLMDDGSGSQFCLDLRNASDPPVVYWDQERSATQVPEVVAPDYLGWFSERLEALSAFRRWGMGY